MNGKVFSISLGVFCLIFGVILFYFQVFAFYQRVDGLSQIEVNGNKVPIKEYKGIDSGSSALKLRGCFKVDPMFFKNQVLAEKPTPLAAPFWFKCFDYEYLHQEIASGRAKVYLAAKDEYDGIDRMVLVFDSGEAYQWRQLNSKFSGK